MKFQHTCCCGAKLVIISEAHDTATGSTITAQESVAIQQIKLFSGRHASCHKKPKHAVFGNSLRNNYE